MIWCRMQDEIRKAVHGLKPTVHSSEYTLHASSNDRGGYMMVGRKREEVLQGSEEAKTGCHIQLRP